MEAVLGILLFALFVWALIKGWIWIVNSIMNPLIEKAEKRDAEALKNNPEYQFWSKAEEIINELDRAIKEAREKQPETDNNPKEPDNIYIAKHFRLLEGHKKAEELRKSLSKGYEQLEKQHEDYLNWCAENKQKPIVDPPVTNRFKVYHID